MGLSNLDVFKCQMYLATKVLCSHVFQQMQPPSTLKWFLEKQMHDEATTKVFAWLLLVDRLDYTTVAKKRKKKTRLHHKHIQNKKEITARDKQDYKNLCR